MALAKRIIPVVLNKRGQAVKGERFSCDRVVGNALQAARTHAIRSVDELCILDVDCSEPNYAMVKKLSAGCFTPLTIGGGVKTDEQVRELLKSGADKICLKSLMQNPNTVEDLANRYGSSTFVAALDWNHENREAWAMTKAEEYESAGVGEILLQAVYRDGTMVGFDLDLIKAVSDAVSIPIIASGGCRDYEDAYQAIQAGADAVAVGALFLFTDATPKGMAKYLADKGVEVRL